MGLLSNRIGRESLKAGDHIYSWRAAWVYAHHGIYVGDDKVIHFTRGRDQEVGTGTFIDLLLVSSGPNRSNMPCSICTDEVNATATTEANGVVSSCLNCFLAGGALYRFEYAVNHSLFLAKARGGTCTLAPSDPNDAVVRRAKHLLGNGFRCYNLFKSNCEDFAIYSKTGLLVAERGVVGQSGQAISIIGGPLAAVISTPFQLVTTNIYGMAVMAIGVYCASRYAADIGNRRRGESGSRGSDGWTGNRQDSGSGEHHSAAGSGTEHYRDHTRCLIKRRIVVVSSRVIYICPDLLYYC